MCRSQMSKSKSQIENCDLEMWMTSCNESARGRFGGFWRKSVSWVPSSEEEGWLSLARRSQASGLVSVVWGRWKSQHRKVYLPPYVEKPFYSKVIKSFVPELRSRKCFSCFGIPKFYVYMLWTFYVRFAYSCMGMLQLDQGICKFQKFCIAKKTLFVNEILLWDRYLLIDGLFQILY